MTLSFDHPPNPDSLLSRMDPRWKLAALLLATAVVAALQSWPAAAVACAGSMGLIFLGRLPLRWVARRWAVVLLFLAPLVLLLPFLSGGGWQWGPIVLSPAGLELAAVMVLKALAIVSLALVLLATAPLPVTFQAAYALRMPGILIQLVALTYRYLFVLVDEFARLRTALRVRGYRNRATLHSYRTIGHVSGALLVRGDERATRVGQAMRCRGFDGQFRSLAEFRTRWWDVAVFLIIAAIAAGLLVLDWLL